MAGDKLLQALNEVREVINGLDKGLIEPLARRRKSVWQAGRLKSKNDVQAVSAPEWVTQVIAPRRAYAEKVDLSPKTAEAIWRSMTDTFTKFEMDTDHTDEAQPEPSDSDFDKKNREEVV